MAQIRWINLAALVALAATAPSQQTFVLYNHNSLDYVQECVRLQVDVRGANAADISVTEDGTPVPCQVELLSGTPASIGTGYLWVCTNLSSLANHTYIVTLNDPAPPAFPPLVTLARSGSQFILNNSLVSVAVAAGGSSSTLPPPFQGIAQLTGVSNPTYLGSSTWNASSNMCGGSAAFVNFSSTIMASGPLFAEVLLNYTFAEGFATWRYRLWPNRLGPIVIENATVCIDAGVDTTLTSAWAPTEVVSNPWFYCNASVPVDPAGALIQNDTQIVQPIAPIGRLPNGMLAYLQPRWSQACDSRWYLSASDGTVSVGVLMGRASVWRWPQYTGAYWSTMRWHIMNAWTDGVHLNIHSPLFGARVYALIVGGVDETDNATATLANLYFMQELDRLTNVYNLEWAGTQPVVGGFSGQFFYDENTNPTGIVRQEGKTLLASLKSGNPPPASRSTLSAGQVWCDPDWYAAYQGYMAPENTNFASDFYVLCIGYMMALSSHPDAATWKAIATSVFQMDLHHSVTMPGATSPPSAKGGAGSESPGYTGHAILSWFAEAPLLDSIYGWNPYTQEPRLPAAVDFFYHASTPWAYHFLGPAAADASIMTGRWLLPLGDTHPNSVNYTIVANTSGIPFPDITTFVSEEYPGFGVFLRNHAGSDSETFFAMKASPNRGHNHGDQLAFHYAAYGMRIAIDIQAGYNPRPYQEYWHNRLAVGVNQNMDGFERLIAFTTSAGVDAAMGQVTSTQLQTLPAIPPDIYNGVYPVAPVAAITYRRTALLVKAAGATHRDYIVLIDAHNVTAISVAAYLAFTFFQQDGQVFSQARASSVDVGNGTLFSFAADGSNNAVGVAFAADRWNWPSEGNENATRVRVSPTTATTAYFISVLYPEGSTSPVMHSSPCGTRGGCVHSRASSLPTVTFDSAAGQLTVTFPDGNVDVITASGLAIDASAEPAGGAAAQVTITRNGGAPTNVLTAADVDLNRSQGDVGLEILDAGYTFGEAPSWVIQQRVNNNPTYPWPPNTALDRLNAL